MPGWAEVALAELAVLHPPSRPPLSYLCSGPLALLFHDGREWYNLLWARVALADCVVFVVWLQRIIIKGG